MVEKELEIIKAHRSQRHRTLLDLSEIEDAPETKMCLLKRIQKGSTKKSPLHGYKIPKKDINSPQSRPEETFPPPIDRVRLEQ